MEKQTLHKVEERLIYLYSLKKDMIPKQAEYRNRYIWQREKEKSQDKSDYKTNTEFSIIQAKASELLSWMQDYDFIPLSDEAYTNQKIIKNIWHYEWIKSKTDKALSQAFFSWLKYWDWYIYEWIRNITRTIKVPSYSWSEITFKEENIPEYEGIYCEYIPWENLYLDWDSLENSNEVIWIKYWDRQAFINSFQNNPQYKNVDDSLPIWRYYYLTSDTLNVNWNINDDEVVTELRYYNKAKDSFITLVNWIEVLNSFIPYKHKELPFCNFVDYFVEWRVYNMWEYELLEEDVLFKDALRSLQIDVIKNQFWFTVIHPDSEFDELSLETGINKYNRIDPKDINHYSPNISANSIIQAEEQVNNDIIIKSWIDFRSQVLTQSETATKTDSKQQSARKRINLNLKLNWYNFFERLARLRMSNIQLLYSSSNKKIPLKWWTIDEKWIFSAINWWYGTFLVKPEYVKWNYNIIPITDSILWLSTEKDKNKFLEFSQVMWNIIWTDGKPIINPEKIVEIWTRLFGYSFDELTAKAEEYQSPDKLLEWVMNEQNWISNDVTNPTNPNYIPPEQRSWNSKIVPTIWWLTQ